MDALDAIGAIWPIALGFVTLVIMLSQNARRYRAD